MHPFEHAQPAEAGESTEPLCVVLDTDIGTDLDDAVALLLLSCIERVRLAMVTTVSGRTEIRAKLARRMLQTVGRGDVPVAAGHAGPLASERFGRMIPDGGLWLGHEGQGVLTAEELAAPLGSDPDGAIEELAATIESVPGGVLAIAIGPLTNLAVALAAHPAIRGRIRRIVAMGGVIEGPAIVGGTPLPGLCEYNLNADREAAAQVLGAGIPVTLVPAELTYCTAWKDVHLDVLRRRRHPATGALCAMAEIWGSIYPALLSGLGVPSPALDGLACHLHDPLAVLVASEPSSFSFEEVRIDIGERDGVLTTEPCAGGAFVVSVPVGVDTDRIGDRCLELIEAGLPTTGAHSARRSRASRPPW